MATSTEIFLSGSNIVKLVGLKSGSGFVNNATVSITLLTPEGHPLLGQAWPQNMAYVGGSSDDYVVTLATLTRLRKNLRYVAKLEVSEPGGLTATFEVPLWGVP